MKRIPFLLLFPLLCLSYSPEEVVLKAEEKLRTLNSFQAHFEQVYFSSTVATPLRERGRFYFQKPDSMRWEYQEPEKKVFVLRSGRLLSYFPEENQLIRRSLSEEEESGILGIFSGKRPLKESYLIEFSPFPSDQQKAWQIKLTPREEGEYSFILLEFHEKTWLLEKAVFFDWAGNKQEFHFSRMKVDPRLPKGTFEIEVPEDCEVIDETPPVKK